MNKISVVIISLNAERKLNDVLLQANKISNDIIVVDSFSTDNTENIALEHNVKFYKKKWEGYSIQKNYGNSLTLNNWILSIDADEVLSDELINEINFINLNNSKIAYNIPFKNVYCGKIIKYGRWKNEFHVRLFNKSMVEWNIDKVHEGLHTNAVKIVKLKNPIFHYSMQSKEEHIKKAKKYSKMSAEKMYLHGKKASLIKRYFNPFFRFVNDYFFRFGFLDGKLGLQLAIIICKETYWKYKNLAELNKQIIA